MGTPTQFIKVNILLGTQHWHNHTLSYSLTYPLSKNSWILFTLTCPLHLKLGSSKRYCTCTESTENNNIWVQLVLLVRKYVFKFELSVSVFLQLLHMWSDLLREEIWIPDCISPANNCCCFFESTCCSSSFWAFSSSCCLSSCSLCFCNSADFMLMSLASLARCCSYSLISSSV